MRNRIDELKTVLKDLGLQAKETDDKGWFSFTFNAITFRFSVDEQQDSMTIGVGYYREHENVDRAKILEVINRLNDKMNYIKVVELGNVFWLAYEMDVELHMPEKEGVKKMIMFLTGAYYHLVSLYDELVGTPENNEEEEAKKGFAWDIFVRKILYQDWFLTYDKTNKE